MTYGSDRPGLRPDRAALAADMRGRVVRALDALGDGEQDLAVELLVEVELALAGAGR